MPTVASFEIGFDRCIGPDGKAAAALPEDAADKAAMVRLYRAMALTRAFDEKAIALQRTGRLGTYASSVGQEAVGVGAAAAMAEADILVPSFREHAAQLWRGAGLKELFLYWGGDERGNDFAGPRRDFPVSIPVASHVPHAAGAALALRLRGENAAALCIFGDGATSKGDFYEAMNIAGVWTLPLVLVVSNNQWAISVPRNAQTRAETLAQKAIAAGIEGGQVDGNDVLAVRDAAARALDRARAGDGPTLIEALTYRLGDHTTVDDASRYRDDEEVGRHWTEEPLARFRAWLAEAHGWDREEEEALLRETREEVEAAAEAYLAEAPEPPEAMFDHLYATLPEPLAEQRAAAVEEAARDG